MLTGSRRLRLPTSAPRSRRQGHPQYPVIAYKTATTSVGAAPTLVETIAKQLNICLSSRNIWGPGKRPKLRPRDGKADIIFGIYYNDERATYLDYVQPAFTLTTSRSSS
jgi:polar amino acid transport system substrate-binding protein